MALEKMEKRWPGETSQAFPQPFNVMPVQPKCSKPGQLSEEQVKNFFDDGFLIVENYFDTAKDLDPVKESIGQLVDELAKKLHKAGKIKSLYEGYGFYQRLSKMEEEFPGTNIILHKMGRLPQPVRDLWSNPKLLNLMEQLLGTEDIIGNPVWNLRTKTPRNEASTVPWHQDAAYLHNESYKVLQPAAWIPLLNATKENGCMQVVRGGHKTGRVARHVGCYGNTWYVMLHDDVINKTLDVNVERDTVTCEVPYGGMLLINNLIPHRSLNNLSDCIRWSLDLRWQRADQPVGFYGIKEGIVMRTAKDQKPAIDWEKFDSVDRHAEAIIDSTNKEELADDFDTVIVGPWMKKWEIVNQNRHTERLADEERFKGKP